MRCAALTGVDTFLGRRLRERLLADSSHLRLVGLDARAASSASPSLQLHRLDLTRPGSGARMAELLRRERVDTLVHLAVPGPGLEGERETEPSVSDEVLSACAEAKVRKIVIVSSTMCYGARLENPHQLCEDAELRGHEGAGWIAKRVRVEQSVARFREAHADCEVSVLRHCWIMGPRFVDPFVRYFEADWVPTILGYDPLLQFVHEDDLLAVIEAATLGSHPGTFNVVGEGVLPLSGYLRLAGKRGIPLPNGLLSLVAGLPTGWGGADSAAGFYDYLKFTWVASGARARAEFGPLVYTSQEAWSAMVTSRRLRQYR